MLHTSLFQVSWSIHKQELMKAGGLVVPFHSIVQIKWSTAEFVMNCAHRVHLRELHSGIRTICCILACNLSHFFVQCLMDSILNLELNVLFKTFYGRYGKEQPQDLSWTVHTQSTKLCTVLHADVLCTTNGVKDVARWPVVSHFFVQCLMDSIL